MATLSVAVPEELKQKMNELDEINWSAVARNAFEDKVKQVTFLKNIVKKSRLTERDANVLSRRINESIAKKFREMK
ncbi:hypothetical protein HYT51_01310 [Candidatus Woesearchaeota archaeon]|nr:hypothetical protein [Candidatus Woesearchaeota archaeon]